MQSGRAFALEITLQRPKPARRTTRATPSATATFDGARTFMHLPSLKLQQTQHLLHIVFRWSVQLILKTKGKKHDQVNH